MTGEFQSWLPALIAFASVVALIVTLRVQQKHQQEAGDQRMGRIENSLDGIGKKIDRLTPRVAELDNLAERMTHVEDSAGESRDVLIAEGMLQPKRATPRARTDPGRRTPAHAAKPVTHDSDGGDNT